MGAPVALSHWRHNHNETAFMEASMIARVSALHSNAVTPLIAPMTLESVWEPETLLKPIS